VVLTLGRHDEFTLFVVVAVRNALPHPDPAVWELALHVRGTPTSWVTTLSWRTAAQVAPA
jgi:hypothetical protein